MRPISRVGRTAALRTNRQFKGVDMERIEGWLRRRFVRLNGEGEAHQADVYRCYTCGVLVTWNRIRRGRTCCLGRLVPTNPKWYEAVGLLLKKS